MEQLVNEKVDALWRAIEGGSSKRGQVKLCPLGPTNSHALTRNQIVVTFSEKRPKKSWFQVYVGEEEVPWEQWYITLYIYFWDSFLFSLPG